MIVRANRTWYFHFGYTALRTKDSLSLTTRDCSPIPLVKPKRSHLYTLYPYTSTMKVIMASNHNDVKFEHDAEDMTAGARLMRYYVSDDPHADALDADSSTAATTGSGRSAEAVSVAQGGKLDSKAASITKKTTRATETTAENESEEKKDDDDGNDNIDYNDTAVIRGDLADLRGDVLFNIVGRYSHQDILEKIATFHPEATFDQRNLIANAIKSRANRQRVTKTIVRAELDANRIANGVAFPKNYRPKIQAQHGEEDGKNVATPNDDGNDSLRH